MFRNIKSEKINFITIIGLIFLKDVDIEKVLVSNMISFGKKKTISTLLVTCIIIIQLNHYI